MTTQGTIVDRSMYDTLPQKNRLRAKPKKSAHFLTVIALIVLDRSERIEYCVIAGRLKYFVLYLAFL